MGPIINRKIGKRVSYYEQHSDRFIFIRTETKPKPTSIVQVYMPTSKSIEKELEKVYEEIEELIKHESR